MSTRNLDTGQERHSKSSWTGRQGDGRSQQQDDHQPPPQQRHDPNNNSAALKNENDASDDEFNRWNLGENVRQEIQVVKDNNHNDKKDKQVMDTSPGARRADTNVSSSNGGAEGSKSRRRRRQNISFFIRVQTPQQQLQQPPRHADNNIMERQSCLFPAFPTTTRDMETVPFQSPKSLHLFDSNMSMDQLLQSPEQTTTSALFQKFNSNSNSNSNNHSSEDGHVDKSNKNGIILVTPHAIGKRIRAHITMETARLVSQVANLGTEDWLRLYNNFTAVEWNNWEINNTNITKDTTTSREVLTTASSDYLKQVARDMAMKTRTPMGDEAQNHSHRHGVVLSMGMADPNLMLLFFNEAFGALQIDDNQVCTLSMLQITNDKALVDLSSTKKTNERNHALPLLLHHPDQFGAIVKNLTQSPLDSDNLDFLLRQGLQSINPVGVVVATMTIWSSAVDMELNRLSKCQYLQFVHIPSSDVVSTAAKIDRATIFLRQSISSLGTVLRKLVSHTDSLCSFRDATLTKVLQRSLEPSSTRILVMGTVSSDITSYERTAHTLNYIHQLVGSTTSHVESPFHPISKQSSSQNKESVDTVLLPSDLAKHPAFLQSYVSDPRQRIAELERKVNQLVSPLSAHPPTKSNLRQSPEEDDNDDSPYRPTNYMDLDPLIFQSDYYKDPTDLKVKSSFTSFSKDEKNDPRDGTDNPTHNDVDDDNDDDHADYWFRNDSTMDTLDNEFASSIKVSMSATHTSDSAAAAEDSKYTLENSYGDNPSQTSQQQQELEKMKYSLAQLERSIREISSKELVSDEKELHGNDSWVLDDKTEDEPDVDSPINDILHHERVPINNNATPNSKSVASLSTPQVNSRRTPKREPFHQERVPMENNATPHTKSVASLSTPQVNSRRTLKREPSPQYVRSTPDWIDSNASNDQTSLLVERYGTDDSRVTAPEDLPISDRIDLDALKYHVYMDSPAMGTPIVIHEDQALEGIKFHPNDDLIVDTSTWDNAGSNENLKSSTMHRSVTVQTGNQSSRETPYRMDSKLSLITSASDEAGCPLVTTPGVPSSISLEIAMESARAPTSQNAMTCMDRLRRYIPPIQANESAHLEIVRPSDGETNDTTVLSGSDGKGNETTDLMSVSQYDGEDNFVFDFAALESAILELKMGNVDSWRKKVSALDVLQQHFIRQQTKNREHEDEMQELEDQLILLDSTYSEELEAVALEVKREKLRADKLSQELEMATNNSSSYEKVAEQAVSSIEGLHEETIRLKAALERQEVESENRRIEVNTLLTEKEELAEKLMQVQNQVSDVSFEKGEVEAIMEDMESKLRSVAQDRDRLKEERDKAILEVDVMRLESDDIADAKALVRAREEEIDTLLKANDDLSTIVFEQQKTLSEEIEKRETHTSSWALEVQTLSLELTAARKRVTDSVGDQQRFRDAVHEEQSALRERLRLVEAERDHLQQLRNTDLSEMETLKLESAIRADLEKRLKAAGSEIDRLRAARSKVHDEIALVRSEAAIMVDEKDNVTQQLKLELHQAKIEVTSLRRRLGDAETEYDRMRKVSEDEMQRWSAKLGAANDELSRLRSELANSVRVRNIDTKEAMDLKVAVQARVTEVTNLKAQLDRLKVEQAESKNVNKTLTESLHDLQSTTKAQLMSISEKNRESDILLAIEKETNATLEAEIGRLRDAVAVARKEQEYKHDGLESLKEDLSRVHREKSDALNKAAHMEKQLKEIEIMVEDLEHELELTKLKSNEDLLRKVKDEYRALQSANAQLSETINDFTSERDASVHDMDLLRRNLDSVQKAKVVSETKCVGLEKVVEQSKHIIEELEHQLKIADMRSQGEPLKRAREESRSHQKKATELHVALERMQGERDDHHRAVQALHTELEKIKKAKKEMKSRVVKLENSKGDMEGHVSTMLSKLRISEHNSNDLHQKLAVAMQAMEDLTHTRDRMQLELDLAKQNRDELERSNQELCQQLEAATEKHLESERAGRRDDEVDTSRNESDGDARRLEKVDERRLHDESILRAMELEIGSLRHQLATRPSEGITRSDLRAERERYEEASQLIVTLAHRAKSSTEQRNRLIRRLRESLVQVSEQKEAEIQALRARLHEWERSIVRGDEYHWP